MTNPDMMYKYVQARHEDIRTAEAARHVAKQVQGATENPAKKAWSNIAAFARRVGSQSLTTTQTSELPQLQLGNEQA